MFLCKFKALLYNESGNRKLNAINYTKPDLVEVYN